MKSAVMPWHTSGGKAGSAVGVEEIVGCGGCADPDGSDPPPGDVGTGPFLSLLSPTPFEGALLSGDCDCDDGSVAGGGARVGGDPPAGVGVLPPSERVGLPSDDAAPGDASGPPVSSPSGAPPPTPPSSCASAGAVASACTFNSQC